jgi:acyl-CoA thioesterase-1
MSRFLSAFRRLPNSFVCLVCFVVTCLPTSPLRAAEPVTKTVVCFGDSLTAGYGLESAATDAYPALLQEKLNASNSPSAKGSNGTAPTVRWRVVNAGLSGETTAGGARRLDWILRQPVDIFLLALGANDGLRGIDPAVSERNLQAPSMGEDYARAFAAMYPKLATRNNLTLLPFLLEGVGGLSDFNQADAIHPNIAGHKILAANVWSLLQPLL